MNTPPPPKPSPLLQAFSYLVMLACVAFLSFCVFPILSFGYAARSFDPTLIFPFGFLAGLLALEQYKGTFRLNLVSARRVSAVVTGLGSLVVLIMCYVLEDAFDNSYPRPWTTIVGMFLLLPVWLVVTYLYMKTSFDWARRLDAYYNSGGVARERRQWSLREIFLVLTLASVLLGCCTLLDRLDRRPMPEPVSWRHFPLMELPDNATEVAYLRGVNDSIVVEFTTDEASFAQWVGEGCGAGSKALGDQAQEITSPRLITRFSMNEEEPLPEKTIMISRGLEYDWSYGGQQKCAFYDRQTSRAYYSAY